MASREWSDLTPQARSEFEAALARATTPDVLPITNWTPARREPIEVTVCITLDGAEIMAFERHMDNLHRLSPNRAPVTPTAISLWLYSEIQRSLDALCDAELSPHERES